MSVNGSLREATWNHPTLGSGTVYGKSGEDANLDKGGRRTNDDANSIDGSGESLDVMAPVRWSVEAPVSWDMFNRKDLDKLTDLAGDPLPADWTFTFENNSVWAGTGKPVGDVAANATNGTIPLKVAGGGVLKQIV